MTQGFRAQGADVGSVVHIQFSVHRITVATEIIDAADYRCGVYYNDKTGELVVTL